MSSHETPIPMRAYPSRDLTGVAEIPGDKSISHRALIFGALAEGTTRITGLLEGEDVLDTASAMRSFGATVTQTGPGAWEVTGVGAAGFAEPDHVIDCGNSGTGVRLIMGAMASFPINACFTGDASLVKRPMARITEPLALFGAEAHGRSGGRLPLVLTGAAEPVAVRYTLPMPSAQVKSAVLLAGLNAPGDTVVIEPEATRDHTERMLQGFGAELRVEETAKGRVITLTGRPRLQAQEIAVPRDPSSAAFPVCAALVTPGAEVRVPGIGLNPTRAGLFTTLREMGADLSYENERSEGGEPAADLLARYSPQMRGITVPAHRAASMIDEYPVLSVVAAYATGVTEMPGVAELRVKESDRIAAMKAALIANGVTVEDGPDWWRVTGLGPEGVPGGARCATHLDHRIAMSCLILGLGAQAPVSVDDGAPIATSFPDFEPLMAALGAKIERED